MKKFFYMAVAAIAALSSCSNDDAFLNEDGQNVTGVTTFTATIEDEGATRTTYNAETKKAEWEATTDKISIDGHEYTADNDGPTTTFTGYGATESTHHAYFPASLYNGGTPTLPATQTYTEGKFNMPMYAESATTSLEFKNLCAVLAIKVTSDDIATLKSIKVKADKALSGAFTVSGDKAVLTNASDNTKTVELVSSSPLNLDATGTTFYIAIPAQNYKYLNIYLSADGTTYKEAMATKKVAGLGDIARSKMYSIDYEKNAVQLWADGPYFATMNIGATSVTDYGYYYSWGGSVNLVDATGTPKYNIDTSELSGDNDTATKLWGSNWCMPKQDELGKAEGGLLYECTCEWTNYNNTGVKGLLCTGKGDYASNSVFLPAAGYRNLGTVYGQGRNGSYWSSTPNGRDDAYFLYFGSGSPDVLSGHRDFGYSVRAVLAEAPANSAKATIGGSEVDVNWVQLWAGGPKFAEFNVGVTDGKPESYGGYYCWGSSIDKDSNGAYKRGTDALTGDDDTATKLWGSAWRMPTKAELDDLLENCDEAWTTVNGVKGRKFTGKGDYASNSVFLPAAGFCLKDSVREQGDYGSYWSSTPNGSYDGSYEACNLDFYSGDRRVDYGSRNYGYSVRAVLAEAPANSAKATIGDRTVYVGWVQLWENGPKFAEYNVGVTDGKAESCGGYYAWGGSQDRVDDHNTGSAVLTGNNDTATKLWGSAWRMPTQAELEALLANCVVEWTTVNGVNGRKFTGKGDYASNSVFLPAAGYFNYGTVYGQGSNGSYWSSTPNSSDDAYFLYFGSGSQDVLSDLRDHVYSVRAVLAE